VVLDINSIQNNLNPIFTKLNQTFKWLTQAGGNFIKNTNIMKKHLIFIIAFVLLAGLLSAQDNKASASLTAAIYEEEVTGNLDKAVELYLDILKKYPDDRTVAAKTLYHLGLVNEKMGKQKASEYFTRLVNTYPDQAEMVALAKVKLAALGTGTAARNIEVSLHQVWVAGKDMPICISPDGRYVVFGVYDSGNLWLRDLQSGDQRQITRDGSRAEGTIASDFAAISQDGKWIAYNWWNKGFEELRLSKLDGSSMRILHNGQDGRTMYVTPTAWMPDGLRILAISFKNLVYRPHIISLQDGSVRDISQPDPGSVIWGYPSPDGRYIAYNLNEDIIVYDTSTEQDSVLVKNPAADGMVGWTPDGTGIIFVSIRSGSRDLYLLDTENGRPRGKPQLLQRDLGDPMYLFVTRDGRLFKIDRKGSYDSYILPVDEQTGKLTGTPSLVDPNYPGANFPAWSPDGKLLYYSLNKGPVGNQSHVLVIHSEETGQTHEITPKPKLPFWHTPILSPDGHRFAVTGADGKGNSGVFAIDSESGEVSQIAMLTEKESVDPSPNWSPDGKAIFYMVRSPEKTDEFIIRRKDLTTGEEQDIHRGIYYREMKISPDGTRFVFFINDKPTKSYMLGILDIISGKELELWRVPGADYPGGISYPSWAPDGRHVMVAAMSLKQGSELWRFPSAGGPGEKIYFSPEATWGFVMHPTGKRMVFTQSLINFELWVMENFLPK
jgi:Tol biopolymer transport system component